MGFFKLLNQKYSLTAKRNYIVANVVPRYYISFKVLFTGVITLHKGKPGLLHSISFIHMKMQWKILDETGNNY